MKFLFIVYNLAIESKVFEKLNQVGIKQYTYLPKIYGRGTNSSPRLGNHTWPGANAGLLIALEEEKKKELISLIQELKKEYLKEGIKVFVFPLEEIL